MRAIYIPLRDKDLDQLAELARREMRDPRTQAAWLIREGLRRAGLLDDETENPAQTAELPEAE